jgi:response regulator RpfG family c-di-GMP phosphodiesterase
VLNPTEDGRWVNGDTAFLHHLGEIAVTDPILAVPAHAQQDDLDRKAAALEQGQQDRSSINRLSLHCQG